MNLFTATAIAASILVATTTLGKFAYNVTYKNDEVKCQYIYKLDKTNKCLHRHLKYEYRYDNEKRLTQKTILKWDALRKDWTHSRQLNYTYNQGSCVVEFSQWNNLRKDYADVLERVIYYYDHTSKVTAYQNFKLNPKTNRWDMVQNMEVTDKEIDLYALE